jgi:hypothetical protein
MDSEWTVDCGVGCHGFSIPSGGNCISRDRSGLKKAESELGFINDYRTMQYDHK